MNVMQLRLIFVRKVASKYGANVTIKIVQFIGESTVSLQTIYLFANRFRDQRFLSMIQRVRCNYNVRLKSAASSNEIKLSEKNVKGEIDW